MTLLNPLGLLALLAIPVIIAIHFLQRRAKHVPISTLFLLQKTQREASSGSKFDRLVNSVPLWLQLLIVVLLTWLLVQPRYVKSNSTQRIAIVIDSSASMSVFKESLREKLGAMIPELQGAAERVELWLLQSDVTRNRLYYGYDPEALLASLDQWTPTSGAIEPSHSLRIARSLSGKDGAVAYFTDTPREAIAYNAHLYALGSPVENVGFTGISFTNNGDQLLWQTLVRNYSDKTVSRTWYMVNDKGQRTSEKTITIDARKIKSLQGSFPADSANAKLVLSGDAFPLDDILPIVQPNPKKLAIYHSTETNLANLSESMRNSFPNIVHSPANVDVDIILWDKLDETIDSADSIVFNQVEGFPESYLEGNIIAEKHPLMDGLNWQSLLVKNVPTLEALEEDEVLLWQGTRPLILLRYLSDQKQCLIFNFDIEHSNLNKTESAVVLLLRFVEQVRSKKISQEQLMTEVSQVLDIATHPVSTESPIQITTTPLAENVSVPASLTITQKRKMYSPEIPSFYTIKQGEETLLTAANYFAYTREADFSQCEEGYVPASSNASAADRHTSEDHLWRYWICLALFAALASWHYTQKAATSS